MAKDILVTERLTDSMMKAGAELVARLDKNNADVKSAFWFYLSEDQVWKFIVASPQVDTIGPREYYKKINEANLLAEDTENVISLNDIGVSNTQNQIVQTLKFAIGTGDGISGIRFSRNTINGIFIEDTYIYRSNS
ncbi:hypothetical protein [Photobacterium lucens]|uniref:hypothetical protein n=1 Tax=Photobacterium lucens TaxID=2562949 RepID=UPI00136A6C96|nr:hypothetical protein [Photobacterium lucens]MBP2701877.1 hypothetical protein [Vibrio parahaemolyticus]MZG58042.1 hypothetical protein [Photobacterium lucens]MZG81328.1 hypothetical protein [Photobacterium lucens]